MLKPVPVRWSDGRSAVPVPWLWGSGVHLRGTGVRCAPPLSGRPRAASRLQRAARPSLTTRFGQEADRDPESRASDQRPRHAGADLSALRSEHQTELASDRDPDCVRCITTERLPVSLFGSGLPAAELYRDGQAPAEEIHAASITRAVLDTHGGPIRHPVQGGPYR